MISSIEYNEEKIVEKLIELIEKFDQNKYEYVTKGYVEAQARTDFIDKLFKILGWDVSNDVGLPQFERDVLVEKNPETTGKPDYSFRVDGETKFFVEAKAPSVGVSNAEDIIQAKTYAWNTKNVFVVVLTDFQELKIYDASLKPDLKHPEIGLVYHLKYIDFVKKVKELVLLSKKSVEEGSLSKILKKDAESKHLRIPVDSAFLEDMTKWREDLAKDLFKKNNNISIRTLNDVVQKMLDRLIFIRILEDRKIINSRTLFEIVELWKHEGKRKPIHENLNELFRHINSDLNGEVFKPHDCEKYEFDSNLLALIIENLYFPKCPYKFDVIGVELLGSIYERYLGKTIRFTEKRVKVEEKLEVKKAGGIYYTPQFIVSAVIESTITKLINDKTPSEIEKIRILDPACGSGSFLLGAYQKLIDYHIKYYSKHQNEAKSGTLFPNLIIDRDGTHRLSIEKKSEILKNNIYGVDLDPQAVEVAMMSLYIKALEGEKALPHNKELLPSLSNNIKCGNSLIGYDFFEQKTLNDNEEKEKINPFEWKSKTTGFGKIFDEKNGFDAIVGNPPYIRIQTMKEWAPKEIEYFGKKYKTAATGNYDIYAIFVEKALEILNERGLLGFILPHKFFQANYGKNLRKIISENKFLKEIVNFTDQQVFEEATTYTCLLFLDKAGNKFFKYSEISKLEHPTHQLQTIQKNNEYKDNYIKIGLLPITEISENQWSFGFGDEIQLLNKLKNLKPKLIDISERMFQGLITSSDDIYLLKNIKEQDSSKFKKLFSRALNKEVIFEKELIKPYLKGKEIKKYTISEPKYSLLFPYTINHNKKLSLIHYDEFEKNFPRAFAYLLENKAALEKREKGKMKSKEKWYDFTRPQSLDMFSHPKIMTPFNAFHNSFYLDTEGKWYFTAGVAGGYGITLKEDSKFSIEYVLGLLNSQLIEYFVKKTGTLLRGKFFSYEYRFIENIPIKKIENEHEKSLEGEIIKLVKEINKISKELEENQHEVLNRQVKVYGEKIDELVYTLYGITEEEKKIIEENLR
jgi:type I restriction-modification system DNA methylase subunit